MSTATIYGHRYDSANDEYTGIISGAEANAPKAWQFSTDVATSWEAAMDEVIPHGTRGVKLRTAMVVSPDRGGVFEVLLRLVRCGLGGQAGNGKQFMSWIHDLDFVRSVEFIIMSDTMSGPVNLASPEPLPNKDFMRVLRQSWGRSFGLRASEWMLEMGAIALQTETELILKSRRVIPKKLVDHGFQFEFPAWNEAAQDLCERWRSMSKR
jgi:uncharacterized protein (TIGR01777 family)